MAGIRVVTDSAADLPAELLEAHDITVVPLDVRIESLAPELGATLAPKEFWDVIISTGAMAETAAPSPGAFLAAFQAAKDAGADGVICVTLSSGLSATFQAASAGAAELAGDFPIEIVDSQLVTLGEGFLVLDAVELASTHDLATVASQLRSQVEKIHVYGGLDSLETLKRGGRIGSAQAFFGSLLAIKPIVEVRGGLVEGESRQRTRTRSLRYLADKVIAAGPLKRLAVAHAAADDIDVFIDMLDQVKPAQELIVTHIGAVIGAHTGPGTIGVCFEVA